MDANILTRSHSLDYGFRKNKPGSPWWTEFSALTQFERPTLLWKAEGGASSHVSVWFSAR